MNHLTSIVEVSEIERGHFGDAPAGLPHQRDQRGLASRAARWQTGSILDRLGRSCALDPAPNFLYAADWGDFDKLAHSQRPSQNGLKGSATAHKTYYALFTRPGRFAGSVERAPGDANRWRGCPNARWNYA